MSGFGVDWVSGQGSRSVSVQKSGSRFGTGVGVVFQDESWGRVSGLGSRSGFGTRVCGLRGQSRILGRRLGSSLEWGSGFWVEVRVKFRDGGRGPVSRSRSKFRIEVEVLIQDEDWDWVTGSESGLARGLGSGLGTGVGVGFRDRDRISGLRFRMGVEVGFWG